MSIKKIFITGATGYIGGAVADYLLKKNYEITALVRNAESAAKLDALGIKTVLGSLQDRPLLQAEALKSDAVIHTADADDTYPVAAFLEALKGTGKTFIHTSGSSLVADDARGQKSDFIYSEDFPLTPVFQKAERVVLNQTIQRAAKDNVRSIVIVPTMIYGEGTGIKKDSIQVPMLMALAKERKVGLHVEAGKNIWSNVHIQDLAELYWLALEKAPAGSYYYAENGEASLEDVATSISRKLGFGGKTESLPLEEAVRLWQFDAAAFGLASNSRVNADKARRMLGWQPKYHSITDNIEQGG
ncbi:MAG: NAD-dependent epimerase/dehydratase family protein [Filimonas sp.]|nr:NAD-dependent epimerase/dehydratase family protein [Filimonas sp.]